MADGTDSRQKMTDEEIEIAAQTALAHSLGSPDSDIGQIRLRNIEAYNAEAKGEFAPPEIADRSDFVATDVADTVNGMLPNIMQMFVASDDAVEFEARSPEAEPEAKLATAYVNHLFYVRNDGVAIVHDWFWDALVQKVGFVKVWAEDEAEDSRQDYEGQTQEQLVMLLQEGWELEGEPEADDNGLLNFSVRKEARSKAIRVMPVAPAEMRVDANSRWDADPNMIGHVFYRPRFEWEQDGYDVSGVGGSASPDSMEMQEILGDGDETASEPAHESHALIKGAEIYIKLDADGDGIAEWIKVCLIEDKLARYTDGEPAWEQVDDHPFVWICPNPRPHAFYGDCPADYAYKPQLLRTRIVRAIEDNLYLSVNGRTYVNTNASVNIDDVLDNRPGGVIRGQGPASDAITAVATPNLSAPAYAFNDYIGGWNENRTGFNRYAAGGDANALNKTARGTELLTAKADMRMGLTARHFAIGVRKLFAKMLKLAIKYQNAVEMVALNGQFVPINPSEFRDQFRVKINVGLGTGTKEQQSARIMALMQMLTQVGAPAGVVRPEHIAEAIRLYVEANEFKQPERFVDPAPQGPPPQVQQMMQQAQEQMGRMQQELQRLAQENAQLKLANRDKQGEQALKARQQDIDAAEASARLDLDAQGVGLDAERLQLDAFTRAHELAQRHDDAGAGY